jgi:tripartite-type tricarboxylate transporter receptor subunit TctC
LSVQPQSSRRSRTLLEGYSGLAGGLTSGAIKGIAVASEERLPDFKDLATVAETLPGFLAGGWNVLLAPVGTPESIINKANADLRNALDGVEVKSKLMTMGAYLHPMTPADVMSFVHEQQHIWRPVAELVAEQSTEREK